MRMKRKMIMNRKIIMMQSWNKNNVDNLKIVINVGRKNVKNKITNMKVIKNRQGKAIKNRQV